MTDKAAAGLQRDMLAAGIDQPRVDLFRRRRRAHADNAVLGMEDDLALGRHEIADERRDADAEIDRPPFRDVARHPRRQFVAAERLPSLFVCHGLLLLDLYRRVAGRDMDEAIDVEAGG